MKVKALAWMGIKTDKFPQMEHFLQDVMGLQQVHHAHDFSVFQLPSKDNVTKNLTLACGKDQRWHNEVVPQTR